MRLHNDTTLFAGSVHKKKKKLGGSQKFYKVEVSLLILINGEKLCKDDLIHPLCNGEAYASVIFR